MSRTAGAVRRSVGWVLVASVATSSTLGCAPDPLANPLADPAKEQQRLETALTRRRWSPDDDFRIRLRILELETAQTGFNRNRYEFRAFTAQFPDRPEGTVSFAREAVEYLDHPGSIDRGDDLALALPSVTAAIAKQPNRADLYLLRYQCQRLAPHRFGHGSAPPDADLQRARAMAPNDPSVRIELAKRQVAALQYPAAEAALRAALALPSAGPVARAKAHALLGQIAQWHQRPDAAVTEYAAALKDDANNVDALYGRAMFEYVRQDTRGFQNDAYRVAQLYPEHPLAMFAGALQQLAYRFPNRDQAERLLRRAAGDDPQNPVFPAMLERMANQAAADARSQQQMLAGFGALLGLGLAAAVAHDMDENDRPALEITSDGYLRRGDACTLTFHNKRGPGKSLVILTQDGTSWKRLVYVERDQTLTVTFHLPGLNSDTIHTTTEAAAGATDDDLSGAVEE